ncbi:alpha/beta fold hydrolase [Streptomyces sp. SAJ15]|uniref:alpha/beta fold hydrolase n=1 Tax=Streptomyces sp. SAJ15 TaxID=2011095 RepID=UPI00118690A5|nr:alpha/beta hydrolase [Streptomyces sp. SAJ15]TVL93822.1 alpha/beta hydrolase [Streptomyces sp. SAJ15]
MRSGPFAPPVPARELTVTSADGARLHVEVHGPEGAPAVVLVHGWTCSTAFWARVIRELAVDHRVITYDLRGHGGSPVARPGGCSTDALADDLEAVLEATLDSAAGQRAVLAGHSMGGMTLMAASARPHFRAHAAAVLLCSTGSSRLPARSHVVPLRAGRLRTALHRAILTSRAPASPLAPLGRRVLRYITLGRDASAEMVEACARIVAGCPRGVRADWGRVLAELDLDRGVTRVAVPTAIVHGAADRLTPVRHAYALAALLPHCVGVTELPGVGHMTPVEDGATVADRIRDLVLHHLTPRVGGTADGASDDLRPHRHDETDETKEPTA